MAFDPGPNGDAIAHRYGVELATGDQARKLQRMEREFGAETVARWADEGMTVDAMGKPRDMEAFRQRKADRSPEIPADIERRNQASRHRNAARRRDDGPAGTTEAPDIVRRAISSPGTEMDESVQREMEEKMGGSFDDVRIHAGPTAARAADAIDARAFTVGNDVAFNRGEYRQDSSEGKQVLAHELTHARQENEGTVSLLPKTDADHPAAGTPTGSHGDTIDRMGTDMYVQPKLEVSSPDDPAEKEAERVAEAVMEMGDGSAGGTEDNPGEGADRQGADRQGADRRTADVGLLRTVPVQRAGDGEVSADGESQVRGAVSGGGKPLPSDTQAEMESKMGADFSNVSVHTGPDADAASKSIGAKAYTMGSNIAFADGNYNPSSQGGKKLLAHELTHVAQQGGAQRKATDGETDVTPSHDPRAATVQRESSSSGGSSEEAVSQPTYVVQPGDYLSKIAREMNIKGGWQELYELNKKNPNGRNVDNPDLIYKGQVLTLPEYVREEKEGGDGSGGGAGSSGDSGGGQSGDADSGGGQQFVGDGTEERGDGGGEDGDDPKAMYDEFKSEYEGVSDETQDKGKELGEISVAKEQLDELGIDVKIHGNAEKPLISYKDEELYKIERKFLDVEREFPVFTPLGIMGEVAVTSKAEAKAGLFGRGQWDMTGQAGWFPSTLSGMAGVHGEGAVSFQTDLGVGVGIPGAISATAGLFVKAKGSLGVLAGPQFGIEFGPEGGLEDFWADSLRFEFTAQVTGNAGAYMEISSLGYQLFRDEFPFVSHPFYTGKFAADVGRVSWMDGFDLASVDWENTKNEFNWPEFPSPSLGEVFGGIANYEDDAARQFIRENPEALAKMDPGEKADFIDDLMDGWEAASTENAILTVIHTADTNEAQRLLLYDAYVKDGAPQSDGDYADYAYEVHYWLDNAMDFGRYTELFEALGGDEYKNAAPYSFRNPDEWTANHPIVDKYIDYHRRNPIQLS